MSSRSELTEITLRIRSSCRAWQEEDLYVRVTGDTIALSPAFIGECQRPLPLSVSRRPGWACGRVGAILMRP
jgi:hypothetical protein